MEENFRSEYQVQVVQVQVRKGYCVYSVKERKA